MSDKSLSEKIRDHVREHGPTSAHELAAIHGVRKEDVHRAAKELTRDQSHGWVGPKGDKLKSFGQRGPAKRLDHDSATALQTGPGGGQFYVTATGRKVYKSS